MDDFEFIARYDIAETKKQKSLERIMLRQSAESCYFPMTITCLLMFMGFQSRGDRREKIMKWIYLEDAEPQKREKYLCCYQSGYVCTGNYLGNGLWKMHGKYSKKPYAWMELPKPADVRPIDLRRFAE